MATAKPASDYFVDIRKMLDEFERLFREANRKSTGPAYEKQKQLKVALAIIEEAVEFQLWRFTKG